MTKSKGINIINKGHKCPNHPDRDAYTKGLCKSCYNKRLLISNTEYAKNQRKNHKDWVKRNLEKCNKYRKEYQQKILPEKKRDRQLKRQYGISLDDYNLMLKQQKGRCAICLKRTNKTLHVDHNHITKKVRGLLCFRCNYGLGYFKDNLNHFKRIVNYLEVSDG